MPAKSKKQQIAMAIAEHEPEKLYKRNKSMKKMTKQQLHDFAATKRKGLPETAPKAEKKRERKEEKQRERKQEQKESKKTDKKEQDMRSKRAALVLIKNKRKK